MAPTLPLLQEIVEDLVVLLGLFALFHFTLVYFCFLYFFLLVCCIFLLMKWF